LDKNGTLLAEVTLAIKSGFGFQRFFLKRKKLIDTGFFPLVFRGYG
jgi:hypothetical protein